MIEYGKAVKSSADGLSVGYGINLKDLSPLFFSIRIEHKHKHVEDECTHEDSTRHKILNA